MTLTKTRCVLTRIVDHNAEVVALGAELATFVSYNDDDNGLHRVVAMTEADWRDMGEPEQVTVTIEPGDLLNR